MARIRSPRAPGTACFCFGASGTVRGDPTRDGAASTIHTSIGSSFTRTRQTIETRGVQYECAMEGCGCLFRRSTRTCAS